MLSLLFKSHILIRASFYNCEYISLHVLHTHAMYIAKAYIYIVKGWKIG